MFFLFLIQYLVAHFVILCGSCAGGVDTGIFQNELDEIGEPFICLYIPFVVGVHVLFMNQQKSCGIVYFTACLVLLMILGIIEMWGFLAPRFFGLLLLFAKASCRCSRKWPSLRLRKVKRPVYSEA